jgi:hypothetical protein
VDGTQILRGDDRGLKPIAMKTTTSNSNARKCSRLVLAAVLTVVTAAALHAQNDSSQPAGVPEDWTFHHSVFPDAGTAEQAIQNRTYQRWLIIVHDPRYQIEQAKRIAAARLLNSIPPDDFVGENDAKESDTPELMQGDSSIPSAEPAVPPRGLTKASTFPPFAGANLEATQNPQTEAWLESLPKPRKSRRHQAKRARLDWSETLGSGGGLGLGNYPAKYSFSISSSSCADWVVYGTGLPGSSTQATILAYTNLYSGTCSGSIPAVAWAFNTGAGSTILTSPVLSLDGTQIAFVQNNPTSGASLTLLKWAKGGTLSAPTALTSQASASAYRSCTAPCMFSIHFSGGANDSGSSAWYDYTLDAVWVGDDNGVLHKFTGAFEGSPAELTTGGWPVTVSASPLSGPIQDSSTGNVFVGDYNLSTDSACTPSASKSSAPCGFLYSYDSSTGAFNAKSAQLDYNFGIVDTPLLDEYAGQLYVPVGSDGEVGTSNNCGTGTPCAGVFQLSTDFSSGATGTEATIGPGYQSLLSGTFDHAYLTSASASSPTGHLYVVGNTGPANNTLYQISVIANVMSTTSMAGPVVAQNYSNGYYASGLNVTDFSNGSTDYVFLSTLAFSNFTGCGTTPSITIGCIVGFNVTSGAISSSMLPVGSSPAAGGASGIIVDNVGSATGESNIYFSALANQSCTTSGGTSGCAIQISQSTP